MYELWAIGEAGLDRVRGGLISDQEIVFRRQVDIRKISGKPMVLACGSVHLTVYCIYVKSLIHPKCGVNTWL